MFIFFSQHCLIYGPEDVRGMTITKEIIPTKADVTTTDLSRFLVVRPGEFIYNPRTHGKRIRLGYKDTDIAFYLSRVGAPACVVGFEEIVAMGAKKFVLFGSCGVLDDDKVKNKLIIPISAVRDEGTSYHYIAPSPEIEADPHSVKILESVLSNCGYPYIKGKTWTSDAIYRETLPLIQERKQESCIAVEMECASMLAVAKYRHIPFIQFLYGADDLSSEIWDIRDLASYGFSNAEKYMVLAFECGLAL